MSEDKLKAIFDSMPTTVSIPFADVKLRENPEEAKREMEENYGFSPDPDIYHPIVIKWSEKGRGFGEYVFWQKDGKIYCDNECDSRETVKRILCQMVDQAVFPEDEKKDE